MIALFFGEKFVERGYAIKCFVERISRFMLRKWICRSRRLHKSRFVPMLPSGIWH